MGARRAEAVFWGADPELFQPLPVDKVVDVFFYGYGDKFRRDWMKAMVGEPSSRASRMSTSRSAGATSAATPARRASSGDVPFNVFARAISEARVNLNITRRAHASVRRRRPADPSSWRWPAPRSSSNPYEGIERWFEPGRELLVVSSADEAVDAYRELLDDPARAEELGRAARERALDEHTYVHRARRLLELLGLRRPGDGAGRWLRRCRRLRARSIPASQR